MNAEIQVLVVDDHPLVRRGLELLLPRHGFRVIGTAASLTEATRLIRLRRPRVAIVDIDLGGESGTDLARQLAEEGCATRVLLHTGYQQVGRLSEAARSGAAGVALKTIAIEELATAIRAVAAGRSFVDAGTQALLRSEPDRAHTITKREAEILTLLAAGLGADDIAARLVLSKETVQTHVRNAIRKLGAHGRLHAVVLAAQHGEISLERDAVT